ncbi:MAG: glycosyltransferase family 39 protein [Anaerolineae bacterium]
MKSLQRYLLIALLLTGALLRLAPIAANRFHEDEAIYGFWALQVATGRDVLLRNFPVDKPPFFIYVLALFLGFFGLSEVAARLPGEVASFSALLLLYFWVRRIYGTEVAILSVALMAFSPFAILFAPTAFTDPLMVALVLGACLAGAEGHFGLGGGMLGLAAITKPQAVFFAPLAAVSGWPSKPKDFCRAVLAFAAAAMLAFVWDAFRFRRPGFLEQSLVSYGGVGFVPPTEWPERFAGWLELLKYTTASPPLNFLLVLGPPVLLVYGFLFRRRARETSFDFSLVGFTFFFLALHVVLSFKVWDRYLLGLVPVLDVLLARVIWHIAYRVSQAVWRKWPGAHLFWSGSSRSSRGRWLSDGSAFCSLVVAVLLVGIMVKPARDAAASRFHIGGDKGAYQGLEAVVDYFRGNVPGGAILYHRLLGWHFSFYMFDFPYDFRCYSSPEELAREARLAAGAKQYVVFPSWVSVAPARAALEASGLALRRVYRAFRRDGSISFTVYRIEPTSQPLDREIRHR